MTDHEALLEAQRRWGTESSPRPTLRLEPGVHRDGTPFGRGFKVGLWCHEASTRAFYPKGEGGSWEAAFADADRRASGPQRGIL